MPINNMIVGIPEGLDLKERLKSATQVRIAVAFATESGWAQIEGAVLGQHKAVDIIVGLNSEITDPRLLDKWLSLSNKRPDSFHVFVAPLKPMFHPKLLIGHRESGDSFAIVGSGNLTLGGQLLNIECVAFLCDEAQIQELENWFYEIQCVPLSNKIIDDYRVRYRAASKSRARSGPASDHLNKLLEAGRSAASLLGLTWDKDRLLADVLEFSASEEGKRTLRNRVKGAERIRGLLRMPSFDFSKTDWEEFYGIEEFGWIQPRYKRMADEVARLRRAFRFLLSKPIDVGRLRSVLHVGQKRHVMGLGSNLISKVLTVHDRYRWPLVNYRVEVALRRYGYRVSQDAEGYLEFAEDMRRFLAAQDRADFWGFDAFCECKSRELES